MRNIESTIFDILILMYILHAI